MRLPLVRSTVVNGAAREPMSLPIMFSVPPASVTVVKFGPGLETVVLASRMSVPMLAVPPLMVKTPLDRPVGRGAVGTLREEELVRDVQTPVPPQGDRALTGVPVHLASVPLLTPMRMLSALNVPVSKVMSAAAVFAPPPAI